MKINKRYIINYYYPFENEDTYLAGHLKIYTCKKYLCDDFIKEKNFFI